MLPRTVVHWQSSVRVGDKFGAEQFLKRFSQLGFRDLSMECPILWVHDGVLLDLYWNHELSFFTFSFTSALVCTRKSEFGQSNISMDHHGAMYGLAYILATKRSDIFKTIST